MQFVGNESYLGKEYFYHLQTVRCRRILCSIFQEKVCIFWSKKYSNLWDIVIAVFWDVVMCNMWGVQVLRYPNFFLVNGSRLKRESCWRRRGCSLGWARPSGNTVLPVECL